MWPQIVFHYFKTRVIMVSRMLEVGTLGLMQELFLYFYSEFLTFFVRMSRMNTSRQIQQTLLTSEKVCK